jgi:hypothetical protein
MAMVSKGESGFGTNDGSESLIAWQSLKIALILKRDSILF